MTALTTVDEQKSYFEQCYGRLEELAKQFEGINDALVSDAVVSRIRGAQNAESIKNTLAHLSVAYALTDDEIMLGIESLVANVKAVEMNLVRNQDLKENGFKEFIDELKADVQAWYDGYVEFKENSASNFRTVIRNTNNLRIGRGEQVLQVIDSIDVKVEANPNVSKLWGMRIGLEKIFGASKTNRVEAAGETVEEVRESEAAKTAPETSGQVVEEAQSQEAQEQEVVTSPFTSRPGEFQRARKVVPPIDHPQSGAEQSTPPTPTPRKQSGALVALGVTVVLGLVAGGAFVWNKFFSNDGDAKIALASDASAQTPSSSTTSLSTTTTSTTTTTTSIPSPTTTIAPENTQASVNAPTQDAVLIPSATQEKVVTKANAPKKKTSHQKTKATAKTRSQIVAEKKAAAEKAAQDARVAEFLKAVKAEQDRQTAINTPSQEAPAPAPVVVVDPVDTVTPPSDPVDTPSDPVVTPPSGEVPDNGEPGTPAPGTETETPDQGGTPGPAPVNEVPADSDLALAF